MKRRVLVSNDDGIEAPGLQALVKGLVQSGLYDVRVGAPETERSGSSHAVQSSVSATLYSDGSCVGLPPSVVAYSANGYPADAVRIAFASDIFGGKWIPEFVVSGINRGLNAGKAVVVSGTVAAAREGVFWDARAVAVSMHSFSSHMRAVEDYAKAVDQVLPILDWFVRADTWPADVILNINIPYENGQGIIPKSLSVVPQGKSAIRFKAVAEAPTEAVPKGQTMHYKFRWEVAMDSQGTPQNDDFVAVINK